MRKHFSRDRGKKTVYDACQNLQLFDREYFFKNFRMDTINVWGFTFLDRSNYSKACFKEIKCNPGGTLCCLTIFSDWILSNNNWYKLQDKSPKKSVHHVCCPAKSPKFFRQFLYLTPPSSCFYMVMP